ncbi:uncharacterized protein [Choristoneura fumiferana]|uniref:uncharacterized protein n=1 Tax=Choristoneura fumiferana TaxID=7141 RepID=UPI003D15933A
MLYDCDISKADWRQVVSNAAIVDYLAEMVDTAGWEAPPQRWDFTTITLCSLATALHRSAHHWGATKVSLLARAVLGLFVSVARFVGSVRAECVKREPAPHVAALPAEWRDIFAPDLNYNLFSVLLKILAEAGTDGAARATAPRVVVLAGLLPCAARLEWAALPAARLEWPG